MALPRISITSPATPSGPTSAPDATPLALVPVWLMTCYFLIVVVGGIVANVLLVVAAAGWPSDRRAGRSHAASSELCDDAEGVQDADAARSSTRDRGWWLLLGQLAGADALALALAAGGELWALREAGGPWRLPSALCSPFMGLDAMLGAAQSYLLVALALHARIMPADPVPRPWRSVARSAVVPSALVWMLASSVAVPRTFLAVTVHPRPSLPMCTLLPTSPTTGALEGPLDAAGPPGPAGSRWPLDGVDGQGGGPLLSALVLCAVPAVLLLAAATGLRCAPLAPADVCPPHKMARREWVRVSSWLAASWLLLSLPRLASAAAHGFLAPDAVPTTTAAFGPAAFRAPPLGSRVLGDASLLAASMLHYALAAARPVVVALASPALRRSVLPLMAPSEARGDRSTRASSTS